MKMIPSKTEASVWADAVRIAGPFAYTGETGARRYFKLVQCIARGILHGAKEQSCNASHAPSDGSGTPRVAPIVSSTGPSSSSPSSSSGSAADPSAAVPAPATILPPLEIADHAEAMGWTPESRVYECGDSFDVYPAERYIRKGYPGAHDSGLSEESFLKCVKGYTLLPNRRVQGEGEDEPTVAGGVKLLDHLRRTPEEMASTPKTATAWEAYLASGAAPQCTVRFTDHDVADFNAFIAEREKRAVERSKLIAKAAQSGFDAMMADAPRPAKSAGEVAEEVVAEIRNATMATETMLRKAHAIITAAIERERAANLAIPATDSGKSAR